MESKKKPTISDYRQLEQQFRTLLRENTQLKRNLALQSRDLKRKKFKLFSAEQQIHTLKNQNIQIQEDLTVAEEALERLLGE